MFSVLLKDMIKDTDKQPDKEMHRLRSERVLTQEVCPCGVARHDSSAKDVWEAPQPYIKSRLLWHNFCFSNKTPLSFEKCM